MEFIKRRILTTIFLTLYFLWWTFCFIFFYGVSDNPRSSCGLANGGLIVFLLAVFIIYFTITLVLMLTSKDQKRKDFLIALIFVIVPMLVGIIDILT
jgi:hypothetical protein